MTPTEQKYFIVDSSVANPAVMSPHLLCSWKSSKMRFHTPVEKSLVKFGNDNAASCYDRIIPALASLIGRKHGIHQNIIFVNARTLNEAKYKLKTLLGVSDEFYQKCTAYAIYRTS
jgi:hypothetical protein